MAATHFSNFHCSTVNVNPADLAATTKSGTDVTITGVAVGDWVSFNPPAGMNDDLVYAGCRVKSANTVTIFIYNPTAGALNEAALDWEYLWIDLT